MPTLLLIILFFLGAILASFIGVIAERVYTGQSWKRGRSKCNSCREQLDGRDLVPVFSWIFYRGRCRQCRVKLPVRYVAGELLLGGLFALSYTSLGLGIPLLLFLAMLCVLYFVVAYDLRHTVVPAHASNLLVLLCVGFALATTASYTALFWHGVVAAIIALFFFCLYFFSKGRAMGLGDAPVAFALSLLVGSQAIAGLMFSFWIGAVVGIGILFLRRGGPRMGIEVPFVPFLALGYLLAYFSLWNPLPFIL
jgi:leader peptidase (prepilin peptidase)/N-methyltransferase